MRTLGEEVLEPGFCFRHRIGARDTDRIEAARPRLFDERRLNLCGCGQKSRLA
jgi:hypothetical protein